MLVGSATRLISGRNAVQTVYWRVKKDGATTRLVKSNKTCTFNKNTKYPRSSPLTDPLRILGVISSTYAKDYYLERKKLSLEVLIVGIEVYLISTKRRENKKK
ncbi:unnamed protein product [Hermetia illucens]|uniref:Uncharacterized protein n=1 Tax=Hermetia illucens TaxID=343691 RepID=A0A7R8UKK4_HERIL|nr:unnamed protein product [Hermetia illucens]